MGTSRNFDAMGPGGRLAGDSAMRFPVYLSDNFRRDRLGKEVAFPERRLVRQGPSDRIIAVIVAPRGSRVRRKPDQHGKEQLVVPMESSFWGRIFGEKVAIPVKYVINSARRGSHGLSLLDPVSESVDESVDTFS